MLRDRAAGRRRPARGSCGSTAVLVVLYLRDRLRRVAEHALEEAGRPRGVFHHASRNPLLPLRCRSAARLARFRTVLPALTRPGADAVAAGNSARSV